MRQTFDAKARRRKGNGIEMDKTLTVAAPAQSGQPFTQDLYLVFLCAFAPLRRADALYGSNTVEPVVLRDSRSRCACAASFSA
jgi:hypothetical protein